jgi:hypothetical protein
MGEVVDVGRPRMLLLELFDAAVEIRALVRHDLPRCPGADTGPLQFRRHRLLR